MSLLNTYGRYGIPRAVRSLRSNWRAKANTVLILTASLATLGMIALLYLNVVHLSRLWLSNTTVSLFLKPGLGQAERESLLERVRANPLVRHATLITPQEGLRELSRNLGAESSLLAGDGKETLPYTIDFDVFYDYRGRVDALARTFRALPGVEDAVYTERMLEKVELFFTLVQGVGLFFIALILVSFYLIVANATHLSLHARRDEIEILNLVGATRGFVGSSFVVEGLILSLASGLLAVGIVWFSHQLLIAGLSWNEMTQGIKSQSIFFPLPEVGEALLAALVLGGVSSRLSVNRLLKELEP
jgi:cell division transport system permease protein